MAINYLHGDATLPKHTDEPRLIAHVVNDKGGWGRGFVVALSKRYPAAERWYRAWSRGKDPESGPFCLGRIQVVPVASDLLVANLLAQHGYRSAANPVPLRYDALERCLKALAERACTEGASIHMPRIGAGLAGGDWTRIESLIEATLIAANITVTVYDLP